MEEVVKFIAKEVMEKAKVTGSPQIMFELDGLGRVRIENRGGYYDLGFSDNMLKLLGLAGSPEAEYLQMKNFDARQQIRDILNGVWLDGYKFDYGDDFVRQGVVTSESEEEFLEVVKAYINLDKLTWFYRNYGLDIEAVNNEASGNQPHKLNVSPQAVIEAVLAPNMQDGLINDGSGRIVPVVPAAEPPKIILMKPPVTADLGAPTPPLSSPERSPLTSFRTLLASYRRSFKFLMTLMKKLYSTEGLPKVISATTPGVLNPVQRMFVYLNIIDPMDVNDRFVKLLKLVNTKGESFKTTQEEFLNPMYHRVQKGKISMIDVLIADEAGDPVSFQIGTVVLTLHFRKASKQRW
jgi:hypothetical protein